MRVMASGTFDILHPGHVIYLNKAKKLGGKNSQLIVVVARDSTVKKRKRLPIINEKQRLELIKSIKPVDEAYLGYEDDMFRIVKEIKPDIIAIGADQNFDIEKLEKDLKIKGFNIKVVRVNDYYNSELDSSCKIIKKIKKTKYTKDNIKEEC